MKRKIALVLVCLLVFAVALPTLEARADSVWFTVINDTILDLGSGTMPTSVGGAVYVPYSVFTNSAFKLYVNYSSGNNLITFMNANTTLTFDVGIGIAYTQDQTIYKQAAAVRGGVTYVPVNFVCEIFGWSWSSLSTGPCVRIRTTSSGLNDGLFESLYQERLEQKKNAYLGVNSQTPAPPTATAARPTPSGASASPSPSPTPEPTKYLTFTVQGALGDSTMGILDQLEGHNRRVLFFLDTENLENRDREALRLVDQGHTLGLLVNPPASYSQEDLDEFFQSLEEKNDALFRTTLQRARLLRFRGGRSMGDVPEAFFERLAREGYRLWDYTLAVPGYVSGERLQKLLEERAGVQVLSFEMDGGGRQSLSQALNLLDGQTYYYRVTDETTTPYNVFNELR